MGEGSSAEVRVDQGRDDTDLCESEPMHHEFGTVFHQQGDDVTLPKSPCLGPAGDLVRRLVELAVAHDLVFEDQRNLPGRPRRLFFDGIRHRERCARTRTGHDRKSAAPALQHAQLACDAFRDRHASDLLTRVIRWVLVTAPLHRVGAEIDETNGRPNFPGRLCSKQRSLGSRRTHGRKTQSNDVEPFISPVSASSPQPRRTPR